MSSSKKTITKIIFKLRISLLVGISFQGYVNEDGDKYVVVFLSNNDSLVHGQPCCLFDDGQDGADDRER